MNRWVFRFVLVGAMAALAFWVWRVWFPSPDRAIRERLAEVARTASFASNEGPLAKVSNSQLLVSFFTTDVEVVIDIPGQSEHSFSGRDDMFERAMAARSHLSGLSVEFPDLKVVVAPDKESAVVNLTANVRIAGDRDAIVHELKLALKKINGRWLIKRIETVKTLS